MSNATIQQVLYLNYLKEEYGNQLKASMIAGITANQVNQNTAQQTAMKTLFGGLVMEQDPNFYSDYEKLGGDVEYLKFAVECFKEIRAMFVRQG